VMDDGPSGLRVIKLGSAPGELPVPIFLALDLSDLVRVRTITKKESSNDLTSCAPLRPPLVGVC